MHCMCSTFYSPNRLETLFSCHHWERSSYWIEHHAERLWDNVLFCRSLDFSIEQVCFSFTFPLDLASFSSVIHLLFSYAIYENILNICLQNGFLPRFSFCSLSSFFFLLFSLVLEIPRTHKFVSQTFHLVQYNRQNYLSNENSHSVKIFQITSRMQTPC